MGWVWVRVSWTVFRNESQSGIRTVRVRVRVGYSVFIQIIVSGRNHVKLFL